MNQNNIKGEAVHVQTCMVQVLENNGIKLVAARDRRRFPRNSDPNNWDPLVPEYCIDEHDSRINQEIE